MAFFINTPGQSTVGSRIGESLGQGLSQGMQVGMQLKLSELMKQQEMKVAGDENELINQQLYKIKSRANPTVVGQLYKMLLDQGDLDQINQIKSIGSGITQPGTGGGGGEQKGSVGDLQNRRSILENNLSKTNSKKAQGEILSEIGKLDKKILDQKKEEREARKEQREIEALPKEDKKWVDDTLHASQSASESLEALDKMKKIRERGKLGVYPSWLSSESRKDRGLYDNLATNFLQLYKSKIFTRGLSQMEFGKLIEDILPNASNTDATNKGREEGLREIASFAAGLGEKLEEFRLPNGNFPKDVRQKATKAFREEIERIHDDVMGKYSSTKTAKEAEKPQEESQEYPEGTTADVDGVPSVFHNGKWVPR